MAVINDADAAEHAGLDALFLVANLDRDLERASVRIDGRAGGGVARVNDVADEIVEPMLPDLPAGVRVKTRDQLL